MALCARMPRTLAALAAAVALHRCGAQADPVAAASGTCATGAAFEDEVVFLALSTQVHMRTARAKADAAAVLEAAAGAATGARQPAAAAKAPAPEEAGAAASGKAPVAPTMLQTGATLQTVSATAEAASANAEVTDEAREISAGLDPWASPWPTAERVVTVPLTLVYAAMLVVFMLLSCMIYLATGCGELLNSVVRPCRKVHRGKSACCHAEPEQAPADSSFLFSVLSRVSAMKAKSDVLYVGAEGAVKVDEAEDSSDEGSSCPRMEMDEEEPESEAEALSSPRSREEEPDATSSPWAAKALTEATLQKLAAVDGLPQPAEPVNDIICVA